MENADPLPREVLPTGGTCSFEFWLDLIRERPRLVVRSLTGTVYVVTLTTLADLVRTMFTTDFSSLVRFLSRFLLAVAMNESVLIILFAHIVVSDLNGETELFRNANGDEAMKPETKREL